LIYEWRVYEVAPGKMGNLNNQFQNTTLKLFEKHGMKVIGFWETVIGTSNNLYYMLAFDNLGHREKAWAEFQSDPEWIKTRQESAKEGPVTLKITNMILRPTAYSPLK
jgi:hypothetical protein